MPEKTENDGFTPQEQLISILPATLAGIVILLAAIAAALLGHSIVNRFYRMILIAYGVSGTIYLILFYLFFVSRLKDKRLFAWINAVLAGLSLGSLTLILPKGVDLLLGLLMIVASISAVLIAGRPPAYFIVISA